MGLPEKDALYLPVTPARNDGVTIHKLTVKDVPVDGFWSITVYNPEGYLEPNQYNAYAVNNITANKGMDGSVAIQFGGCDGEIPNCLPIMKGWNYTVRMEIPRGTACQLRPANVALPDTRAMSFFDPRGPVNRTSGYLCSVHAGRFGKDGELHFWGNLSRPPRLRREHEKSRIRAARANKLTTSPLPIPAAAYAMPPWLIVGFGIIWHCHANLARVPRILPMCCTPEASQPFCLAGHVRKGANDQLNPQATAWAA